jgi:hypothetical protein
MAWFAIRRLYLFDSRPDGLNVFEERVVTFEAATKDAACEKARREADEYATFHGYEVHPDQTCYEIEELVDVVMTEGCEVFSELLQARKSLAEFFAARWEQYRYEPPSL